MKHTDKQMLVSGIKKLALALPLLILSPYLLTLSFINKDNFMFYLALILGLIAGAAAIYLCFKGINTIIKSMFG
ncbi:MAG: DUF6095 family protein [Altibacter sp.]|uniref:DUF6095 family protein n=1 Tax=Altibacter sp. TaxID=2024823 RepID=UPI001DD8F67F|nr:DUF6095 family protein [Altibacter sp.]MBZ0326071.1 DUF6095 family protein [Altibacter sp.]